MSTDEEVRVKYTVAEHWLKILQSPISRIEDAPSWARVWAIPAGLVQWALSDVFTGILVLVVASTIADWYYGRKAARVADRYESLVAQFGLHSKFAGILILFLVRGFEWWLATAATELDTRGFIATGLAVLLFAQDVESVAYHRRVLGARPMPGLSQAVAFLRRTAEVFLPQDVHDDPKEHETERQEKKGKGPPRWMPEDLGSEDGSNGRG